MYPVLFELPTPFGPLPVYSFGACAGAAFLVSYLLICRLALARGIDDDHITDIYLILIVASIACARLTYVATHWSEFAPNPLAFFKTWEGGLTYLGGFVAGVSCVIFYPLIRGFPVGPYLDMFATAIPLSAIFGRLGCLLNGCCFGTVSSLPWAMVFPPRTGGGPEPRHPTQAYEMVLLGVLSFILWKFYWRNRRPGMALVAATYLYAVERFAIEFIRAEVLTEHYLFGLTLAQSSCLIAAAVAVGYHLYLLRQPPGPTPAELALQDPPPPRKKKKRLFADRSGSSPRLDVWKR